MKLSITNYEEYTICEDGTIWRNGRQLKPWKSNSGYLVVCLSKNGKKERKYVHRLVAQMFLNDGQEITLTVNHKDGNKSNNHVKNLEIISQSDNNKHAFATQLKNQPIQIKNQMAMLSYLKMT